MILVSKMKIGSSNAFFRDKCSSLANLPSVTKQTFIFIIGLHPEKRGGWTTQAVRLKLPATVVRQNRGCGCNYHPPRGEGIHHAWGRRYLHLQTNVRHRIRGRPQVYSQRRQSDGGDRGGDGDYRVKHLPSPPL